MMHPIIRNKKSISYYLLIWILLSIIQSAILYLFYDIESGLALWDGFTFNMFFCALSLHYWYAIKYINVETSSVLSVFINHLAAAFIAISIWLYSGYWVLKLISSEPSYLQFLSNTIPARFLVGLFLYAVIILVYYLFHYYSNLQEKTKNEVLLQTLVKEAELNILKSQINPHFIFNSLNSISMLTITQPEQAREMIIKLSEFFRYALDQDMKHKTILGKELENITRYLEIEKIRFSKRLKYILLIDPPCEEALLPNMILQPLVENAIKHGVHESTEAITIEVSCKMDQNILRINIKNNYDSEGRISQKSGMGINNIQNRLRLIYNRNDLISIIDSVNEFEAQLAFPQQP